MAELAACGHEGVWHGLYRRDYDLATPESMSHPAKAAWDLAFRILEHLKELGLADPEQSTILDPMAGTGRFCIAACAQGYRAVAVELEPKFVAMMEANKEYAGKKLGRELDWQIIQGDARLLSQLLTERGLVAVSSPPYAKEEHSRWRNREKWDYFNPKAGYGDAYGSTPGQIGNLPNKPIIGLTSPPYAGNASGEINPPEYRSDGKSFRAGRSMKGEGYGTTPGQLGNLPDKPIAITSPPYADTFSPREGGEIKPEWGKYREKRGKDLAYNPDNPANIGNLPDLPLTAITSPPYDDALTTGKHRDDNSINPQKLAWRLTRKTSKREYEKRVTEGYGQAEGQIGQEQGDTYLSAMRQVYAEIAKVAGVLVVVTKNPTRNGKLRRLDLDTITLLEATGWRIHCQHQAMLFEEQEQGHLFEGSQKQAKGRLSFFKRLAWRKGSPVAKHEDVIVAVKA